jgi:hypothetical protein
MGTTKKETFEHWEILSQKSKTHFRKLRFISRIVVVLLAFFMALLQSFNHNAFYK